MFRKSFLLLLVFFFFYSWRVACAGLIINEAQLYPTANRFIELYNSSNSEIDLTDWYLQRKTATGSSFSSLVSKTNFENKKINASGYFLISRSSLENSDIVLDNLTLTESNIIQIKNSSGEVVDLVCWGEITDCAAPNPAEGQSLGRDPNNLLAVGIPTPSRPNYSSSDVNIPNTSDNIEIISSTSENSSASKEQKIQTQILAKNIAFAGVPLEFQINTTGYYSETLSYGKYFLNFGDGDFKEMRINEDRFTHTYFYPGEYNVNLEYYLVYYSENPEATDKMVIKIISPDIAISKVGLDADFFVELTNNTNYDADLSNWILTSDNTSFILPKNTILGPKKKIILSPHITNFSITDKSTLKLMTPQRTVIYDYNASNIPVVQNKTISQSQTVTDAVFPIASLPEKIPAENLTASLPLSGSADNNSRVPIFTFVLFLGATSSAVYFLRRRKGPVKAGDDFELIDE